MITKNKQNRMCVLDVETTGFHPNKGDRIVEIGVVELVDRRPTGRQFHVYVDPQRSMPEDAFRVHGLDDAFLAGKPKFAEIIEGFNKFIEGSELVIQNAPFDMGFLNMELARAGSESLDYRVCGVIDTLVMSRMEGGAKRHSLDALCDRYGVNNKHRTLHGALLDAQLLSEVYVCMTRGQGTFLNDRSIEDVEAGKGSMHFDDLVVISIVVSEQEERDHLNYLSGMNKEAGGKMVAWIA